LQVLDTLLVNTPAPQTLGTDTMPLFLLVAAPDGVAPAVITTLGVVFAAALGLIGVLLTIVLRNQGQVKKSNAATLHQVKNSHDINLRDDLDGKQDEVRDLLVQVRNDVGDVRVDLREVRQTAHDDREENRRQTALVARQVTQLREDLENTKPVIRKRKPLNT
jgi:hypothetical protein